MALTDRNLRGWQWWGGEACQGRVCLFSFFIVYWLYLVSHLIRLFVILLAKQKPQNASNMKQQDGKKNYKNSYFLALFLRKIYSYIVFMGSFLLIIQVPVISTFMHLTWTLFLLLLCHPSRIQVIQLKKNKISTNQAYQTNLGFTLLISHKQGEVVSNKGPQRKRRKGDICTITVHP